MSSRIHASPRTIAGAAPVLELRGVSFSYADGSKDGAGPRTVEGFSLDVGPGEVTALVGPNGCGKSTLLRLADGLLAPAEGSVLVGGVDLVGLSARERARAVALLPQIHRTPSMTVEDLVMCGRYAHMGVFGRPGEEDRRVVAKAMEDVGVAGIARRQARHLSGGQRQSAFIAMALAQEAASLLLDEPTTYLDVAAAFGVMALVRRLARERGLAVLVVMHDIDLALRTADRVAVMDAGRRVSLAAASAPETQRAIERVFDIGLSRVGGADGPAYVCFPRT